MREVKHAPLPWTQYCGGTLIYGGDRFFIGVVQSKNAEADTDFIVKACNAFYENEAEIARLNAALENMASSCPREEVSVDRSLLEVAISEIREWKVNKGGDDQVLLNLESGLRKHDENTARASNV